MKQNIALQLYTVREPLAKDFDRTLRKVAALGFRGVELAGDWGGYTPEQLKELLLQIDLVPVSSHVSIDELEQNLDEVLDKHERLGCRTIYCPYLEEERRTSKGYEELSRSLTKILTICKKRGFRFGYHHHDFELGLVNGSVPLKNIFNDGELLAELDVYWLAKSGEEADEWIEQYRDQVKHVHLKDMTGDERQFFAPVGAGVLPIARFVDAGKSSVEWWVIEQDDWEEDPFICIEKSLQFVKTLL